jgi:hypothetical protein
MLMSLQVFWRAGSDPYYLWVSGWDSFKAKWEELSKQNLRLVDFKVYPKPGGTTFGGVWRSGSDGHYLWVGVDWNNFNAKWKELSKQNLRLVDLEIYQEAGVTMPASGVRAATAITSGSVSTGRTSHPGGRSWRSRTSGSLPSRSTPGHVMRPAPTRC